LSPTPETQREAQRRYFESVDSGYMAPTGSTYINRQVSALVAFGELEPGMRVLEVGCGMGRYSLPLANLGFRVEALDISPVLLQRLRTLDPDGRVATHCASVADHPLELDGACDAAIGFFVLHHLEDLVAQFRAMARVLRPGGRVVFLEPNPYNPMYYAQITLSPNMHWWAEKGIFDMRRKVVLPALRAAGFSDPKCRNFGFLPPFAVNTAKGAAMESALERFRPWNALLPFQLFRADLG
jgi:2-polyprenyl-3-methyl-5-hydroxy-6-metoxy-1,4-benzoquinol methylase